MKNILLPTDFSECAWNATKYALSFFKESKCNFFLLHVCTLNSLVECDTPYLPTREAIENLYLKPAKKQLRQVLKRIALEVPQNKNHNFYILTEYAFFVDSIRKQIKEKRIDMIVMGAKGASQIHEHIMGSNTDNVITKVKCSSLIIPEGALFRPPKEIAFPTDFILSYNIKILYPISDLLNETKAALRILHIIGKEKELTADQQSNKELLEDFFNAFEHSTHFLTNRNVEDAVQCFIESRDIDIVVMVAKNLNYFQQILFHSKVEKVSYHTRIPFLVLHE